MTTKALRFSSLVTLSLALTCFASDAQSGPDQYAARHHDQSHPHRSFNEAVKALNSQHRFDLPPKKPVNKEGNVFDNNIASDLQVGCGDGLFVETTTTPRPPIPKHKRVFPRKDRRKREARDRKWRACFSYVIHTPAAISYSVWNPQIYKLQKPYYIPLFGTEERFPIYFPPHPVYINSELPADNLPQSPDKEYPIPTLNKVANRFGSPVWDTQPVSTTTTTSPNPTRRPSRPNTSTFPPLVHRPDPNLSPQRPSAVTTTTAPPPPAAVEVLPTPAAFQSNPVPVATPNQCVWAIINCCSAGSRAVSQNCFERLGCPGPFWDRSPCEGDFAREAVDYALNFYQNK